MSINKLLVTGNLTRDPELRQTPSGASVLSFGIAVNDRRRNASSGEWENYANFVDCSIFGARADALSRILVKGMKVAIEGKLRYSSWERDGQRRSKLDINVDEIEFLSRNNDYNSQGQSQGYGSQSQGYASQQQGQSYGNPAPAASPEPYQSPGQYQQPAEQPAESGYMDIPPAPEISVYDEDIPF